MNVDGKVGFGRLGVVAYNIGVSHGLAQQMIAQGAQATPPYPYPYPYPYGWYRPRGFGFGFPIFFFVLIWFVLIRSVFWGRRWRGFFLHLLAGVVYFIAGVFMIENPIAAAVGLTLLVAACLLVGGILRIVLSVAERFDGWRWILLNGLISLLLGVSIWRQWPLSGQWVIGLFVGIEILFSGLSWLMLGLAVRSAPRAALPP